MIKDIGQIPDELSIKIRLTNKNDKKKWCDFLNATDLMKTHKARIFRGIDVFLKSIAEGTDTKSIADAIAIRNLVDYFQGNGEEMKAYLVGILGAMMKNQPLEVLKALFEHIERFNFEEHRR